MQVKAHILRDEKLEGWREQIVGRWTYRQLAADPRWSKGWISFDAVAFHPGDGAIYCGLNSIDGDLLYRFDPVSERFECMETKHQQDFGFCDSMAYDGDRYIYAGTVAGVLGRIDIETGRVEKVLNALSTCRFPALAVRSGVLYGAGGMHGATQLLRWNTRSDDIELFSDLVDRSTGQRPARIHELAVDGSGRVYLGENDNHERSSYLWSVVLD